MGKGSKARPFSVSQEEFANSFELIFGKKDKMQVRVQENADEIGKCGCGRSPTGKCIGWHGLTEEQFVERKELYETGKVDLAGREVIGLCRCGLSKNKPFCDGAHNGNFTHEATAFALPPKKTV